MKAVVFHGVGDIRLDNVREPRLMKPTDAIIRITAVPEEVADDQAILLSDIFPTGYFAAQLAEVEPGDVVAVFGCGPVGMFAIASAMLLGAGRVLAVDRVPDRLEIARSLGAEVIDFEHDDPVEALRDLTDGIGPDRAIDAVGVDAEPAAHGPGKPGREDMQHFREELANVVPKSRARNGNWVPGRAPSQALRWAVAALAKAGTLSIVGVYPDTMEGLPLGQAMEKNLTIKMGNCNHRRYIPELLRIVQRGEFDPSILVTRQGPLVDAISAYESFDRREAGWLKVELRPSEQAELPKAAGPSGKPGARRRERSAAHRA